MKANFTFSCVQAAKKVESAIRGKNDCRLKDVAMMGVFSHTGCNEVLNSLHLKVPVVVTFIVLGISVK